MEKLPQDPVRQPDDGKSRDELDRIFKAGTEARRIGRSMHDNPYAAGSEERDEWDAGWRATADCDEEGKPEPTL